MKRHLNQLWPFYLLAFFLIFATFTLGGGGRGDEAEPRVVRTKAWVPSTTPLATPIPAPLPSPVPTPPPITVAPLPDPTPLETPVPLPPPAPTPPPTGPSPCYASTDPGVDQEEATLFDLVNDYRVSQGLGALAWSEGLIRTADWRVHDMATNNYYSHYSSDGRSPFQVMTWCGVSDNYPAGENLVVGTHDPQVVLKLWIESPPHHDILVMPGLHHIGLARASGAYGNWSTWYWALEVSNGP